MSDHVLLIDNYDSFAHNLARYITLTGWTCDVVRNDKITCEDIAKRAPKSIIISPGPCTPAEAGICVDAIKTFGAGIPILGVCLGHQCIGEAYGAKTIKNETPCHGISSTIMHSGRGIFDGVPSPMSVGRYHSLIIDMNNCTDLEITATTQNETIMAIEHRNHPVYGVQFHPESILTQHGMDIIQNFKTLTQDFHAKP